MYQPILSKISSELSVRNALKIAKYINKYESRFNFSGFKKSSRYCEEELIKAGAEEVEIIKVPADGKTVFMDCVMPFGWEVEKAVLKVVSPASMKGEVLASYQKEPFFISLYSSPTPPEGIEAEVVLEEDIRRGGDIKGKIVLLDSQHAAHPARKGIGETGAIGLISSWTRGGQENPDAVAWVNGWTDSPGWYYRKEDRKLFCFSISFRKAELLRKIIRTNKQLLVHAEIKSKIYNDYFNTVTGIIPGTTRKKEEIILLSHLYEPLANDDAAGCAALIEMLRTLNTLIKQGKLSPPKRSIRVLLSWELYGFSAYFEKRKDVLPNIIAAMNFDGPSFKQTLAGVPLKLRLTADSLPFISDTLLKKVTREYLPQKLSKFKWEIEKANFSDDTFMADSSIGIPANWLHQPEGKYWHTNQNTFDKLDPKLYQFIMEMGSTYAYFLASAGDKEANWLIQETVKEAKNLIKKERSQKRILYLASVEKKRIETTARLAGGVKGLIKKSIQDIDNFAKKKIKKAMSLPGATVDRNIQISSNIIPKRKVLGFPHCQAKVPPAERRDLSTHIKHILSWMDGKRNLSEIMEKVEMEKDISLDDKERRSIISDCLFLEKYNYIDIRYKVSLSKKDIIDSLRKIGIKPGDILLVHTSLSSLGHIEGGPDTVIDALLKVVGPKGTLCMPAFTYSTANANPPFIPYDLKKTPVRVGKIADTFWHKKGVLRSRHPSHGLAAIGPRAMEILKDNEKYSPYAREGAFGNLYDLDAKILLFGCGLAPNSAFHCLEDWANLPSMEPDDYLIIDDKGKEKKIKYLKEPMGHREFYMSDRMVSKIEKVLRENKAIKEIALGLGKLILIKSKSLMDIGLKAIKKYPDILYCDDPKCESCTRYRRKLKL